MKSVEEAKEELKNRHPDPPQFEWPAAVELKPRAVEWYREPPPPLDYTVNPLLPRGIVSLLVAEGGTGKSNFALRTAIAVATGRPLFGMPTRAGRVVYLGAEDHPDSLRRRIHSILQDELITMRDDEHRSAEEIERFECGVAENFIHDSLVGYQLALIQTVFQMCMQGPALGALIERLPEPLELMVLDPLARFHSDEENNTSVGTALINAAERIARERHCTVLLPHHTGKSKGEDKTLYASRGASSIADGARAVIRLRAVTEQEGRTYENVPPEVIARGDLLEVIHAKINDGPKAETFLLRRQGHAFHRFEPQGTSRRTQHARIMRRLFEWYGRREQAPFSKDRVSKNKETLGEVFGAQRVSRAQVREVYDEAIAAGDLVASDQRAENNRDFLVRFRPGYEPPAPPADEEGPM